VHASIPRVGLVADDAYLDALDRVLQDVEAGTAPTMLAEIADLYGLSPTRVEELNTRYLDSLASVPPERVERLRAALTDPTVQK
jgi:hypothetical protein